MSNEDYFEFKFYSTLTDASELINDVGLKAFLESLYQEKKGRVLTIEEQEAMQTLHERWEL